MEYVKLNKRFYVDSGRTRRDGSEGHKDGFKVFRAAPRVSKVSVKTDPTTNACVDAKRSRHRWPQSHCNSDGTPSAGERPLWEVFPEVRPENSTAIVQSGTSLASDATECDVPRGFFNLLCTGTNTCHRRHLAAITSLPSSLRIILLALL